MGSTPREYPIIACSICTASFADESATASDNSHRGGGATTATTRQSSSSSRRNIRAIALPRSGGLDASFVNIPHYPATPAGVDGTSNFKNAVHDIEIILGDALQSSNSNTSVGVVGGVRRKENINGSDMQEASRRMDAFLESALTIMSSEGDSNSVEGGDDGSRRDFYCQSCLDRIGLAMDTCSERLEEECVAYDKVASSEEERMLLLSNVLSSVNSDALDDQDEDAMHRAIEAFQYELNTLENACDEQQNELRMLQNLMQEQMDRSTVISNQEDTVHQELNSLEIDARIFAEESRLVSNSCSAVESEIDAMSRVKLMTIPFDIRIHHKDSDWNDQGITPKARYPTINNLRLAYRVNDKAGLWRDEINAAFCNAAQLVAFTLGLYPSAITSTIQIIPIRPCAKILVNLPEGQTVHNLGFDNTQDDMDQCNHIPTQSIALFLVLLSELSVHITETNQGKLLDEPPFHMTEFSIDNVDVTKLGNSNAVAWSSVVYCIAANLHWLSQLGIGQSCV